MDTPTELRRDASTVYVVDDGADYRFMVQKVFARFLPHYAVTLFPGGEALLNHLRMSLTRPSLILLDLHMPGMSGLQTLTQLKQDRFADSADGDASSALLTAAGIAPAGTPERHRGSPPGPVRDQPLRSIPVVMVTSSSSAKEIQACYEAGANSCLAKPIGLNPMRECLTLICNYWMETNRPFQA